MLYGHIIRKAVEDEVVNVALRRGRTMKKILLILNLLIVHATIYCDEMHYALPVGEQDKDRLLVLNEIYNPESFKLLQQFVNPGDRVLDVGCGLGLCSQQMAHLVGEKGSVLAIDISQEQLILAEKLKASTLKNLEFRRLSAFELERLEKKFDIVYMRLLLEHVPEPGKILEQVKKVLKPDGKIIIEDITGNYTFYSEPNTPEMAEVQRFDTLQFEIEQSDDCYFEQLPQLLINHRFSIRFLTRSHPQLDTLRKRSMLSYGLSSLKDALINANKITSAEYERVYLAVKRFEQRSDVTIYSYEMGQIVAKLR